MGAVVALSIVTGIIALLHWHAVFVVIGAIGVIWALVWWRIYRDPHQHPKANSVIYFFITFFPSYLVEERNFDLLKLGFFGWAPEGFARACFPA